MNATPASSYVPLRTSPRHDHAFHGRAGEPLLQARTTVAGNSIRAAGEAYRTCLTQHGVTLPARRTSIAAATTGGFGRGGAASNATPAAPSG